MGRTCPASGWLISPLPSDDRASAPWKQDHSLRRCSRSATCLGALATAVGEDGFAEGLAGAREADGGAVDGDVERGGGLGQRLIVEVDAPHDVLVARGETDEKPRAQARETISSGVAWSIVAASSPSLRSRVARMA